MLKRTGWICKDCETFFKSKELATNHDCRIKLNDLGYQIKIWEQMAVGRCEEQPDGSSYVSSQFCFAPAVELTPLLDAATKGDLGGIIRKGHLVGPPYCITHLREKLEEPGRYFQKSFTPGWQNPFPFTQKSCFICKEPAKYNFYSLNGLQKTQARGQPVHEKCLKLLVNSQELIAHEEMIKIVGAKSRRTIAEG